MRDEIEYVVVGLGAWGSAAAYHLAKAGCSVLGLEQFAFGHNRGASHDTSRILRHSYHTPDYVRLSFDAYDDWTALEHDSDTTLVTQVGGLDLFPPDAATSIEDYTDAMRALDVEFEELGATDVGQRWPQFAVPDGTVGLYQARGSIVPAGRGTQTMQELARRYGADLREHVKVCDVRDRGDAVEVRTADTTFACRKLIVCADAWTNQVLNGLDWQIPLTTTLEQVTYFQPADPGTFIPGRLPLWIWMDEPCFYGFPCYGDTTVKAAQDCGGAEVTGDTRPFEPDPDRIALLSDFMAATLPRAGPATKSLTCLYTLTPDRDFVLGTVPGHDAVSVGVGAGHGFKFAPVVGRMLAELAQADETRFDVTPFRLDRRSLTDPHAPIQWRM